MRAVSAIWPVPTWVVVNPVTFAPSGSASAAVSQSAVRSAGDSSTDAVTPAVYHVRGSVGDDRVSGCGGEVGDHRRLRWVVVARSEAVAVSNSGDREDGLAGVLRDSGQIGRDLLAVDWAKTPLGPITGW